MTQARGKTDTLEQLRVDLMYLANRQKALEDAFEALAHEIEAWSSFITEVHIRGGVNLIKHKRGDKYFKDSLKHTHKQTYEKFESVFKLIEGVRGGEEWHIT